MRAIFYTKTGKAKNVLQIGNFDDPKIKKDEVILEIHYSSVNPADTKKRSGWISKAINSEFIIPHSDGAGKVVEVGNKKYKSLIGKNVWICGGSKEQIFGTCAQYFAVNVKNVIEIPKNISSSTASCLGVPVATAYYSIFSYKNYKEKFIFISGGAGSVSQYAIQISKINGYKVLTTVSSKKKEKICKKIGADVIINYKKTKSQDIVNIVKEFTKGKMLDRCIEVDFGYNINLLPKLLKNNGIISSYSSSTIVNPKLEYYLYAPKGIKINIVQAFLHDNNYLRKISQYINNLIVKNKIIHPEIKTFGFKDAFKSHDYIENPIKIGKSNVKL